MDSQQLRRMDADLTDFVSELFQGMGRVERRTAMHRYVEGLLLDGERKSMEPIARRLVTEEREVEGMRQRLQECIAQAKWSEHELYGRLGRKLESELPGIEAMIIDDTGFPKKGIHSVGVQRQYSGALGRVDNCQVGVSLHLASERGSSCIGMRLYMPQDWLADEERCAKVGVPQGVTFQTKPQIALGQIDDALSWGLRKRVVLADAGFGDNTEFRSELAARDLSYVVGIQSSLKVWAPGTSPIAPSEQPRGGRGRPRTRFETGAQKPVTVLELTRAMGTGVLKSVNWREGVKGPKQSRFGAVRVHTSHRHAMGEPPGPEVWLLWAWPKGAEHPQKFWLSNLPSTTSLKRLVYFAKLRWRIERDYQEMKSELGLDHYEGRTWRGWHHHCALVALAHAFLTLQRVLSPPILPELDAA
jgi:SRSO17 transposase